MLQNPTHSPRACNGHHPTCCASDITGMVVRQSEFSETHRRDVVNPRFEREHYAFRAADGLNGNARPPQAHRHRTCLYSV
jgi:hypothetical protein